MPQILTANRLADGEVVYLAAEGVWVEDLSLAHGITSAEEGKTALQKGAEAERELYVVNAYLLDMAPAGSPVKMREIIRAAGPTVRRDLGKQARA
jgi:Protein of unknown function (DUF2849)